MRFFILLLLIIININPIFSQNEDQIFIGVKKTIHSQILDENREVWIYTPKSMEDNSKSIYPVLYLLDGDYIFHATTGITEFLSKNQICPEMIVVGIMNTNRNRDFLPTHNASMKDSGGAEQFKNFLQNELIPHIELTYPVAPYKVLVGHSLSGIFTVHTLLHSPELFNAYIAIDPSLWWDNGIMLEQLREKEDNLVLTGKLFYMTSASLKRGINLSDILNDTANKNNEVKINYDFYNLLESIKVKTNLDSQFRYYPNETHPTLPLISIYDGFQYIFDFYKRPSFANVADTSFNAKEILVEHYEKVSKKMGYLILPPDDLIEGIAFLYRINDMMDKAAEILELKKLKEHYE